MPGFTDSLNQTLGIGRVTSGWRSPEEQDELHRRGKTRVKGGGSAHNRGSADAPGAIDIGGVGPDKKDEVRRRVEEQTGRKISKIIWETGQGRNQGTGAHFHIEFGDGDTASVGQDGSFTPPSVNAQATPQEKERMAQPRQTVQDAFAPETTQGLQNAYQESDSRLGFADQLLNQFITESRDLRAQQEQQLTQTVDVKKRINDQSRADLARLTELATPVWQEREALATRMLDLDNMNPLEAGIRGMFDPNYNRNNLRARIRSQDEALGYLESIFEDRQKYSGTLAQLAQADYNDSAAVADLLIANGGEDVRLALQSFGVATQDMDLMLKGMQADSALISAKNQAREDILSGMSAGQINEAVQQAAGNGGVAIVNGVELRMGELTESQRRLQSQETSLRMQQIALERGEQDLIDANEVNIIETMTLADVKSAVANGYNFKGVQLDPVKVGARLQQLQETQATVNAQNSLESAPGLIHSMFQQYAGATRARAARFTGLFGVVPEEYNRQLTQDQAQINAFRKGLDQAKATGTVEEYLATSMPVIQGMMDNQAKQVTATVKKWAGGNADLEALGQAWMSGQPLSSDAALKGLIQMARTGIPSGTKFTGTAARVYAEVEKAVRLHDQAGGGGGAPMTVEDALGTGGGGGSRAERDAAFLQEIRGKIAGVYNQTLGDQAFRMIPRAAQDIKVNGKPHPFSRVSMQDWNQAVNMGDQAGLASTAQAYNMKPADLEAMLAQGPKGALWTEVTRGKSGPEASWSKLLSSLQANQLQETMAILDVNAGDTGFVPSQQLRDLVTRPEFSTMIQQSDATTGNGSFGGFVASMAAGGGFSQEASNLIDNIDAAYTTRNAATMQVRRRRAQALMGDPLARTQFILGAVSGLSPQQEQLIMKSIKATFTRNVMDEVDPMGTPGGAGMWGASPADTDQLRQIDAFIRSAKTGNPELDDALKIARKQWDVLANPINQSIDKSFGGQ